MSGQDVVLRLVFRDLDQYIARPGGLAAGYISINWWGETPEEIEPEEQRVIDLLKEYDASLKA
jgi:hypothetical protein